MPVSRFYRQIPFITAFFASLLLFTGGVDILVRFCFLPDYVRQVFEYSRFRVQAQGGGGSSSSGQTGGSGIPTPSQPVSQSEGIDLVSGKGPNGLMVIFSWQTATTSYQITATRPSTNYVISRAESPDIIIASGTAAPLDTWIQSAEAADAMTNGGMTLKYQVPEGEVILTLRQMSSVIGLIEISLPSIVIPNKIYTVNYTLSRPLPDISQLPPDERPSIKLSIQSPHMGETTYYFPLESRKQAGQFHFIFHHYDLKQLNAVPQSPYGDNCQFSCQLNINGDQLVVGETSYPVDTSPKTGSFSLKMIRNPYTRYSYDNTFFTPHEDQPVVEILFANYQYPYDAYDINHISIKSLGTLQVTGAQDDDMLVAFSFSTNASGYEHSMILGAWPVSFIFGSNSNPQATRSVPLEKVLLPTARPAFFDNFVSYAIVRQQGNEIKWTHLTEHSFFGGVLGGSNNIGFTSLFPYSPKLEWPYPTHVLYENYFQLFYEAPGFYNTSRGTRLYTGLIMLNGSSNPRGSPRSQLLQWLLNLLRLSSNYVTYDYVTPPNRRDLGAVFEIELRDKEGNPLHVEYDPVDINTGWHSNEGGMPPPLPPALPPGQHDPAPSLILGFKAELPDVRNCSAYPLFMKIKVKYRMPHRMKLSSTPPYHPQCVELWENFPYFETVYYVTVRPFFVVYRNETYYYAPFGPNGYITNPCFLNGGTARIFPALPFAPVQIPLLRGDMIPDPGQAQERDSYTAVTQLSCLNCPGPQPVPVPFTTSAVSMGPPEIVISPFTMNNLIKLHARQRPPSERFTEFDFFHMRATYGNGKSQDFYIQAVRPPAIMGQHVPVVATQSGLYSALARDANQACEPETTFDNLFDNLPNSRTPCGIATRFYYPGFPTRRLVYMSYWGFPKEKQHDQYSQNSFGGIQDTSFLPNSYFRIGVAEHEAVPSSNSSSSDSDPWNFFEGFGTIYAISRSLDGNGQLNGPLYTMLPRAGSYHDPNIHSTLEHIVLGDPPVDQKSPGCPNFPDAESVTITPAEPPPTNFPTFVTVNVNAQNYDYGIISGGMEPVFFFRNGSYQVGIPGGRARRGITVTLYADSCPSATREFLFPPPPVRPAGWRIAADPSFPVVQSAPVVEGQRLYWQGPTFEQGLPVLKNLSSMYQEKFGNTLPEVPPSPVRQGVTQFLNTKPTGNRIATW